MAARMFIALVPEPTELAELEDFLVPRLDADANLRWTKPDSWHVTMAFMGSVPAHTVEPLIENLRAVAESHVRFDVTLTGPGFFGRPDAARQLYLGAAPAEPLGRLAEASRTAAHRAGIDADGATFVPHLTLGRFRRPTNPARWLEVLGAAPASGFSARHLVLLESHLHDPMNRYEVVEQVALRSASGRA